MKVLHWNESVEGGKMTGIRRYEDELFEGMRKKGVDVERIQRRKSKLFGNVPISWLLRYRCRNADVVHATTQTGIPAIMFKKPKKFVATVHDLIPLVYPSSIEDISKRIQWLLIPKYVNKVDRIIAISKFVKEELIRLLGGKEEKIEVVYEGVDHKMFRPMDKEECKLAFGLNPDEKHILVVSMNEVQRRMDIVKEVFRKIKEIREDVKLLKAGYAQGLEGEGIINTGWIPDEKLPMLYNAADVLLHPSEYETFGFPIVEAMACGIPVVLANAGSNPEIVGSCGEMIDLHSEDYVERFVECILKSIEKGVDYKAVEQSKKFTWEKTVEETIRVYEEVL